MPVILVIDDDPHIRQVVEFALRKAGLEVVLARDGAEGLELFGARAPDLVVLDILMPELDGLEVCRRLRARSRVPIIFLTSVDDEPDRIVGLELGGDDYVTKPFSPRELVARIRAVLRRTTAATTPPEPPDRQLRAGSLLVDLDLRTVHWDGQAVELTATEFNILVVLLGYPGKVFTRDELLSRAYPDGVFVNDRTIDSHMKRIRKKFEQLEAQPIDTVHGLGYRIPRR